MKVYGGIDHGREAVVTLPEAIRVLLSMHTIWDAFGDIQAIRGAAPKLNPEEQRRYREAWLVLGQSAAALAAPPAGEISVAWIEEAQRALASAAEVRLEPALYLKLLAAARNGLQPRSLHR